MPAKQTPTKPKKISPVLFLTVDGEPMTFYVRPGSNKCFINPYIKAGGGVVCNVQKPGAILLIDPEEGFSIPENTVHQYVSIHYVRDCVAQGVQLDLESYRLHPEDKKIEALATTSLGGGRMPFTPEEDAAILQYIGKHNVVYQLKGNRPWQEMEKAGVTSHSWQSMKARFKKYLFEMLKAAKTDTKIDALSTRTESTQTKIEQMQVTITPSRKAPEEASAAEAESVSEEDSAAQAESVSEEASAAQAESVSEEASAAQAESVSEEASAAQAESVSEEASEAQAESLSEEASAAQVESVPDTPTPKMPKPVQPQRRSTRRQLELEEPAVPRPYGKKLRSASTPPHQQLKSSPRLAKKSTIRPASEDAPTTDKPPPKRARGRAGAAGTESSQESGQETSTEKAQADEESHPVPQEGGKAKRKRKLGILESAAMEFEDESESCEDETTEPQAALTESQVPASEDAPPQSDPERGPVPQENGAEAQASTSSRLPETSCPEPAAAEPLPSTSKAHLFIFDSESQEEETQCVCGDDAAASSDPQPPPAKRGEPSLTQVQLEEDKQRIRELMSQTKQDLVCVTKALLKTSGDFAAALRLLSNDSEFPGPFWNRHDDSLLLSGDPAVRQNLLEKYGEENTAKRIVFLEAED